MLCVSATTNNNNSNLSSSTSVVAGLVDDVALWTVEASSSKKDHEARAEGPLIQAIEMPPLQELVLLQRPQQVYGNACVAGLEVARLAHRVVSRLVYPSRLQVLEVPLLLACTNATKGVSRLAR